jgi:hypothetical protein
VQQFEKVAEETFVKHKDSRTIFSKALELLLAYIEDGRYSVSAIQDAFKVALGSEIKMFSPLRNDTRVAVTTTTTATDCPRTVHKLQRW